MEKQEKPFLLIVLGCEQLCMVLKQVTMAWKWQAVDGRAGHN